MSLAQTKKSKKYDDVEMLGLLKYLAYQHRVFLLATALILTWFWVLVTQVPMAAQGLR